MNPRNCLFSDSGKLDIRRDHQHRRIEMKILHGVWPSGGSSKVRIPSKSIKRFRGCEGGRNLLCHIDFAIGLFKIAISQQIKEVVNGHEKLNRPVISETP